LSGEAYFEVTPDAAKPFRVLIKDAEIEVLGTNFNVRAYENDPVSKTTLMEGSVKMVTRSDRRILTPGEQAQITYASTGEIAVTHIMTSGVMTSGVDADAIMSWKKGDFRFTDESIRTVMHVLERYYDIDTQFDPNVPDKKITGIVSKGNGLQQNLKSLESITGFHFITHGKTVQVTL